MPMASGRLSGRSSSASNADENCGLSNEIPSELSRVWFPKFRRGCCLTLRIGIDGNNRGKAGFGGKTCWFKDMGGCRRCEAPSSFDRSVRPSTLQTPPCRTMCLKFQTALKQQLFAVYKSFRLHPKPGWAKRSWCRADSDLSTNAESADFRNFGHFVPLPQVPPNMQPEALMRERSIMGHF